MLLDIQFRIKNNPQYKEYLRTHSYWYKSLTRYPASIKEFENEVKKFYKLTPLDRLNKATETLELIKSVMSILK